MDDKVFDNIKHADLKETMETSYIDYAMSVIAARALPDVRDGLKPVQRRILYSMIELNNGPDKPHRKSARIVGDTMGKYHPHGDSSIYGALVNLAQDWSTRYPLVDGHGNFGSEDGDGAAAMRYTEARLSKISMEMTADINKDTVDFVPNFDETEKEPVVLPSRYPNLLVNGTTGIAVGMATNIPPHNLRESIAAVVKIIDNIVENDRETTIDELLEIVKGPDFPTGATILGTRGIDEAYRTGRGKIKVRAVSEIDTLPNGKSQIVVTELPYGVNKARLIEKIAELARDKRIDGITDVNDYSDRDGYRVVIDVRRDANANVILNQLYKHTQMQDTFGVNMLALVGGEPKVMSLLEMLNEYLKHQEDVITRRSRYELNKAEERAHILKGLLIALDNIDEVIRLIRASETAADAKLSLMEAFGFSDAQAQAIVDMRLRALTGLERAKLENELKELEEQIERLKMILSDRKLLLGVIKEEINLISKKYGDDRRTKIGFDVDDIDNEDLIPRQDVVITMTSKGYIKRMDPDTFKAQNRGGKGIKGMPTIDEDYIEELFMANSHEFVLFFTNLGRVYKLKAYEVPESSRTARGMNIVNLLQLQNGEKIDFVISCKALDDDKYLAIATRNGLIKKTPLSEYANIRKTGIAAITLREDDALVGVKVVEEGDNIILVTRKGNCIRFKESDARSCGRTSMGVRGILLNKGDEVISMIKESDGRCLLMISQKGLGKRTLVTDFKLQNRGGKGVRGYNILEKTGDLVGSRAVDDDDEIMVINTQGILIRMKVSDINILGRSTSGVKLVNIKDENVAVASFTKVVDSEADEEGADTEDADANEGSADVEDTNANEGSVDIEDAE